MSMSSAAMLPRLTLRARIAAHVHALRQWQARQAEYRATIRELDALSDRELDDLNIGRGDIHALARRSAGLR